jgi:tartrate-resistant acid phosphatase type 5
MRHSHWILLKRRPPHWLIWALVVIAACGARGSLFEPWLAAAGGGSGHGGAASAGTFGGGLGGKSAGGVGPGGSAGSTGGAGAPAGAGGGSSGNAGAGGDRACLPHDAGVGTVRFAVLGDFGYSGPAEASVAELIQRRAPDFVVTTGDNNYPSGGADTIDANIGRYYAEYICPYRGAYGPGAVVNRFFPALGNHDWYTPGAKPYLEYFTLPGNERYYDVVWGPVHLFVLDSDPNEPDGVLADSVQADWLRTHLAASPARWQLVFMHHPPYSSAMHGPTVAMQWPYAEWGADLVMAGHDHAYERFEIEGLTYVVTGLGGASIYAFSQPLAGSVARYNGNYGAVFVEAGAGELEVSFVDVENQLVDRFRLTD